jgi:4-amino-4-deoxy-L-arabinose transferase-like glycosyltransferase
MKRKIFLIFILILGIILRVYQLGQTPKGISSDEASLGYNAYSLLKTGKDEFGVILPLSLKAFGEYKAPLYSYLSIISILILDLNEVSVRLPSVVFSILTLLMVYLLVRELFHREKTALLSAFVFGVIPWNLQFGRVAYEGNLMLLLMCAGVYFLRRGFLQNKYFLLSTFFLCLSLYSHYNIRLFLPIFLISLFFIFKDKILNNKKIFSINLVIGILLITPLITNTLRNEKNSRYNFINLFNDTGIPLTVNEKVAGHKWQGIGSSFSIRLMHNKISESAVRFVENYSSHFNPLFLLFTGDDSKFFKTPGSGLLLLTFLPLLLLGIVNLLKHLNLEAKLILSWLLISPVASSLTRMSASSNRAFMMLVPVVILIGLGIEELFNYFEKNKQKNMLLVSLSIILFFDFAYYLDNYHVHLSAKYGKDIQYQTKETVQALSNYENRYDKIWITPKFPGYIHLLFHLRYPPEKYQNQANLSELDEFGFGHVTGFDKYYFSPIPKYYDFSKNIFYIATESELPKSVIPFYKIKYMDWYDAYLFTDTETIKKQCPQCNLIYKPITDSI